MSFNTKKFQKEFKSIAKTISDAKEAAKEQCQARIVDLFREFWEVAPDFLTSFGWHQYTPSFNDGDPCYFCTDLYVESMVVTVEPGTFPGEDYGDNGPYIMDELWELEGNDNFDTINSILEDITLVLRQIPDDLLEDLWDTNRTVIVSREAITTEWYDCGH